MGLLQFKRQGNDKPSETHKMMHECTFRCGKKKEGRSRDISLEWRVQMHALPLRVHQSPFRKAFQNN